MTSNYLCPWSYR